MNAGGQFFTDFQHIWYTDS